MINGRTRGSAMPIMAMAAAPGLLPLPPLPPAPRNHCRCALSKQGHRLLTSLDAVGGDLTASERLIRRFVVSSSKSAALSAFSHLLSSPRRRHPHLALPMYRIITKAPWFKWDTKSLAEVIALLESHGHILESETLMSNFTANLNSQGLGLLYCELIESYSKNKLQQRAVISFEKLNRIPEIAGSVRLRGYRSMINGLCELGLPSVAEEMVNEMKHEGFKPSTFDLRRVLYCYGHLGLFPEMQRIVNEIGELDTVTANMVLSCYGSRGELSEMLHWLQKMRELGMIFTVRTYNSVLNSCPGLMHILKDYQCLPLSVEELLNRLGKELSMEGEVELIKELVNSEVLVQQLEWSDLEGKLDLHGMHLGSAYLIVLQCMDEMRAKASIGSNFPMEILLVCGSGKHSTVMGESAVKKLVSDMMFQTSSPLRIDRKNVGRFVARGRSVKDWLQLTL